MRFFREKIQEMNFDQRPQNFQQEDLDVLADDSMENEYFPLFREEEAELPEPTLQNLPQISKTIQVFLLKFRIEDRFSLGRLAIFQKNQTVPIFWA